jgi:hypothetical protein
MNKIYFAAPVLAMLIFTGVYVTYQSGAKQREAIAEKQAKQEKDDKLKAEADARAKAFADAMKAQEMRKKERAEKEARELAEKEERQTQLDLRDKTFREQDKIAKTMERLKKEIEAEKAAAAKIQESIGFIEAEQTFLQGFIAKARENIKTLESLISQIAAAESTRAAAEAAAAKKTS